MVDIPIKLRGQSTNQHNSHQKQDKDILTGCWLIYQVRLAGGKVFSLVQLILISSPTEYLVMLIMKMGVVIMVVMFMYTLSR